MHLDQNHMKSQIQYESSLFFVKKMLETGIITDSEYEAAKGLLEGKYHPLIRHYTFTIYAFRVIDMTMRKVEIIQPNAPLLTERTKVAVYARVSQEGEMNEHSLKAQVDHYSKLISANPRWENVGIFADYGLTGTDAARPGFQNLIAFCDTGKVDLVLVKSISRFCRNTEIGRAHV